MSLNPTEVNPSTPRPEGQGLLKVDPERRFSIPSSKMGAGAVGRVNNYLRPFLGQYEDSFQEAWVKILESKKFST